ncbi:GvpL/GvpF family gas vesicle protein [Thermoactinospora rubra]|uniref:GvpL/GvpF family gas vesicle protein n=1 Tax=Thermoactinospora rubra TaxID=1088767 RepID=UPI000A103183|nr:GvpL/GvpF family gas vesicle protein [Thermoactinospora rubra]
MTQPAGADHGFYVYGVVPADVEVSPDARGVGDPPSPVDLVRHREIGALVSKVPLDRPLGRPDDLVAHEQLLDATAAEVPVLPIRFGAVLSQAEAVVEELLGPHHDEFAAALKELDGRVEYLVKGRYVEQVVLREVLEENPEAARLREQIVGQSAEATRDLRIQLGEIINQAIAAKREADTRALAERLQPYCLQAAVRPPTHEQDAVQLALLVETDRGPELEEAVQEVAESWAERVTLRVLGPLAPYDFATTSRQG